MKSSDRMVMVVARKHADQVKLAGSESLMEVPCGTAGRVIAEKVLNGGGSALISAVDVKMATDNISGLDMFLDNFHVFDVSTREHLWYSVFRNL